MKSGFLAVMALLGNVSAVQLKQEDSTDPAYYAGLYTNILLDVDAFKHKHQRHHKPHPHANQDEYDGDSNTVSQYDAMDNHTPWTNEQRKDWFEERDKH